MAFAECALIDSSLSTWGPCMQDTFFFGDSIVYSLVIFFMFTLIIYKARLPGEFALPVLTGIALATAFLTGATTFVILSIVGFGFSFIYMALVILRKMGVF